MTDAHALGPWLRRFLEEYLVSEHNLARNTQLSYRDTLVLLLRFAAAQARTPVDRLTVRDLGAERVRAFLAHLEQERGCSPRTRNQRLAAIRCFARYVAGRCPEHVAWCNQVRASAGRLPGKARDRRLTRCPGHFHAPGPARARPALVSLPHRSSSIRGGATDRQEPATGQQRPGPLARHLAGQGRQDPPVSAAARLGESTRAAGPRARSRGGGLPQSAAATDHPLRHPPTGQPLCGESRPAVTVARRQEGRTAPAAPYGGNTHAALGSGSQHHPSLASPSLLCSRQHSTGLAHGQTDFSNSSY